MAKGSNVFQVQDFCWPCVVHIKANLFQMQWKLSRNICSHIAIKNRLDLLYFEIQQFLNVLPCPRTWLNILTWQLDCGSTGNLLPDCCAANRFISAWWNSSFIPQDHCLHSGTHFKPCINIKRQTGSKLHALVYITMWTLTQTHSFFLCKRTHTHHPFPKAWYVNTECSYK